MSLAIAHFIFVRVASHTTIELRFAMGRKVTLLFPKSQSCLAIDRPADLSIDLLAGDFQSHARSDRKGLITGDLAAALRNVGDRNGKPTAVREN